MRAGEDVLDGVHVQAATHDFGRQRVLLLELQEAGSLAFGDRGHPRLVSLRVLLHARGRAFGNGDDAVGGRLRLFDEALLIGERLVGIALRRDDRLGNLHVGEVYRRDRDAGVVEVERALNEFFGPPRDLRPGRADQHIIERAASDDFANGALADLAQRELRIAHAEQHLARIGELVLHRETHVDEVHV